MLERIIAQFRAQSLRIGMSPDIHDLRDQPMLVPKNVFRGVPPNVFAGERKQVHEVILHGRRPAIHRRLSGGFQRDSRASRSILNYREFRRRDLSCSCGQDQDSREVIVVAFATSDLERMGIKGIAALRKRHDRSRHA